MKLDIGSGDHRIAGYTPIDRKLGLEAWPLPVPDNSVSEIRASHILEHFGWGDVAAVLADWFRALRPGGLLRVAVPDFDKIAASKDPRRFIWLMGAQRDENDFHRSAFTADSLAADLRRAGFAPPATRWVSELHDCAALPISLNLAAVKPHESPK